MREAAVIGPSTATLVEQIPHAKPHPEQGFRACIGILRLVRAWGAERVEAACRRGIALPTEPYAYAEWRRCRAGIDYHVAGGAEQRPGGGAEHRAGLCALEEMRRQPDSAARDFEDRLALMVDR
jgi:hypothetical protein